MILVGGGGHCKSVIDVIEGTEHKILGIIDKPELVGETILGYPVIGTDSDIPTYVDKACFLITVGQIKSCNIRRSLARIIEDAGGKFATIIANDAYVSKHAKVGEGTVILHKAFVNANAVIGCNCIINTMTNVEHDAVIGDFCHISTGTMVNGETKVGNNCFIGSGSVLYNCITIKDDSVIPAGTIVRKSI